MSHWQPNDGRRRRRAARREDEFGQLTVEVALAF